MIGMASKPSSSAPFFTAATQLASNFTGGEYQISLKSMVRPLALQASSAATFSSAAILERMVSSGWRKSTVKKTLPGMVFRELGLLVIIPTVAQAKGWFAWPILLTAVTTLAAPTSASLRTFMGVGPAWAS